MKLRHIGPPLLALTLCGCRVSDSARVPAAPAPAGKLPARIHNSGFELAHDTYNGISAASDGKIYYVLSSDKAEVAAQMYSYDPAADKIRHLGDLTEACGEKMRFRKIR